MCCALLLTENATPILRLQRIAKIGYITNRSERTSDMMVRSSFLLEVGNGSERKRKSFLCRATKMVKSCLGRMTKTEMCVIMIKNTGVFEKGFDLLCCSA